MNTHNLSIPSKSVILALGAESAGNFAVWKKGILWHSSDFGDLLEDGSFNRFERELRVFLVKEKIKPNVVACDLHPDFKTTLLAKKLAEKYRAQILPVQHHIAHIFSAIADKKIQNLKFKIQNSFYGIASDGTGYGTDGKIWGGEIFAVESRKSKVHKVTRVGHLENQWMIGGQKAIEEPARMLLAIADKLKTQNARRKVLEFLKTYYSENEILVLQKQLAQKFNCVETSSTARVLDAASLLLGFCENVRKFKHALIDELEKNSTNPYNDIRPKIENQSSGQFMLNTTHLFEYLVKNIHKDKKRLAATAQIYIAKGLGLVIKKNRKTHNTSRDIFFSGGIANNKIISEYLESKGAYVSKKIPRGDAGISLGQIAYCLLANSRD